MSILARSDDIRARSNRDNALDGLRALALAAVIVIHTKPISLPRGWIGLELFFVLSGFLITGLVTRELDRTGSFDLRAFYTRRAVRLWPAFFLMLAGVAVLSPLVPHATGMTGALLSAATFTINWRYAFDLGSSWIIGQTWSLAVEQQFYVVWPLLLLLVPRPRRVPVTLALLAGEVTWRVWLAAHGATHARIYGGSDTHSDALLVGALLSMLEHRLPTTPLRAWPAAAVVGAWALFAEIGATEPAIGLATRIPLAALLSALLLIASRQPGPVRDVLSWWPIVKMRRLSYSIYLWHWPMIAVAGAFLYHGHMIVGVAATMPIAWLSYRYAELPALRRGTHRPAPATAAAPPLEDMPAARGG